MAKNKLQTNSIVQNNIVLAYSRIAVKVELRTHHGRTDIKKTFTGSFASRFVNQSISWDTRSKSDRKCVFVNHSRQLCIILVHWHTGMIYLWKMNYSKCASQRIL